MSSARLPILALTAALALLTSACSSTPEQPWLPASTYVSRDLGHTEVWLDQNVADAPLEGTYSLGQYETQVPCEVDEESRGFLVRVESSNAAREALIAGESGLWLELDGTDPEAPSWGLRLQMDSQELLLMARIEIDSVVESDSRFIALQEDDSGQVTREWLERVRAHLESEELQTLAWQLPVQSAARGGIEAELARLEEGATKGAWYLSTFAD